MKIGKYTLHIIESGGLSLDGGAMFGIIPKPLWEKSNPADEKNRVKLFTRNLLLISDAKKVLIDTGMGLKWDEKSTEIYDINLERDELVESLSKLSIAPSEITDVLLTHLHFDHTGGSTKLDNGKLIPTFPNAKYHVQKRNFDWALNPSDKDKGSYIKDNFVPLAEFGVLNFLTEKDISFDEEIEILTINGHTFGQQIFKISDSTRTLLFSGDLLPFSSHIHLPYIMSYDLQPLVTLEEKKQILAKAVEESWILCFEHDPFFAMATVVRTKNGYNAHEKFNTF